MSFTSPFPSSPWILFLSGALLLFPALGTADAAPASEELSPPAQRWVGSTLRSLSLEEKAAQMIGIRTFGRYYHPRSPEYLHLLHEVRDLKVGGIVVFASEVDSIPRLLNRLQGEADVPLIVSADMERGMAFRVVEGTVPLPYAMAIGATRSEELARFAGEVTAREGRALGIHWALAPVVDVNVNPDNPVIHVRSFGEDPELVARLGEAFIRGARDGGFLTTAKHFPGHGDTSVDSHLALPTVTAGRERLEAVELLPFRRAVAAGVDSVMIGHLAVPALDPSSSPATLSPQLTDGLLRRDMGFEGLVVTDAMEMKGVGGVWAGRAAVRAVQAGSDVLLLPPDTRVAIRSIVRAVEEGELTEERLDASVEKILQAKARLGLHRERFVDAGAVERQVADPDDVERALEAARASITVVRNEAGVLPLQVEKALRLVHITLAGNVRRYLITDVPESELEERRVETVAFTVGSELSAATEEAIVAAAAEATHVVVSAFTRTAGLSPSQESLLHRLGGLEPPLVVISFGSPYLLREIPEVPVYLCAYGAAPSSQRAAIGALFGEFAVGGKLPVTLPGLYAYGHGLEIPERDLTLRESEDARMPAGTFAEVDRIVESYVERRAFPGAVLAVGYRGALVHLRPYGRLLYDKDAPAVKADTIYDLASLTKVVATTTAAMILVDEGGLDLDAPVSSYLPLFRGGEKDAVTIRHLLTHSSGVDWWAPLFETLRGPRAYVRHIQAMELAYPPGSATKYSDLGIILLGEILERVSGQRLDEFVRERLFEPLGMVDTHFRPGAEVEREPPYVPPGATLERIAPTEHDDWRGRLVHGEVHDENAYALGGVAPHAGLFSTAGDLARFVQMLLQGGVWDHRRIVSRYRVVNFTQPAGLVEGSTRGLGWDTKSPEKSSAGTLFSPRSFGHTGFTGTSIWVDPERRLFVILLTNRVHPTRENTLIREVRPAVADAVVRALESR